jgi:pimeloyl-ACP methyl ester carboxylesterase
VTTFALIHGGGHGGWCWELLIPELEARGHRAVAPDLPCEDPDAGALEYANVVVDALGDTSDDVVAVGHSLGGLTVPVVANIRPVRKMVFLGAMVPAPNEIYMEFLAEQPALTAAPEKSGYDERGVHPARDWTAARHAYYHDIPESVGLHATERLRPQSLRPMTERSPIEYWPDIPSAYILMTEDRSVDQNWSRRVARDRLGVKAIELPGSHSPFFSCPDLLADILVKLAGSPAQD